MRPLSWPSSHQIAREEAVLQPEARPTAAEALAILQAGAREALGEEAVYVVREGYARADPEHQQIVWNGWAVACRRFGLHEQALVRIDRAAAFAPHDPAMLIICGSILMDLGRLQEALAAYDAALTAPPAEDRVNRNVVWNEKGNLYSERGRYGETDEAYAVALEAMPEAADTWFNRVGNQRDWGETERAAEYSEAAQQHVAQGLVYIKCAEDLGYGSLALSQLRAALKRDRDHGGDA